MKWIASNGRSVHLPGEEFRLVGSERDTVAATLAPFLLDPASLEESLDRTESALVSYQEWSVIHADLRPGDRGAVERELLTLSKAATEYLNAASGLSDEALERLTAIYEFYPAFEDEGRAPSYPNYNHLVDPDRFRGSRRTASVVAGRARLVAGEVAAEKRKTGRPRNRAAYDACHRMADIWMEFTGRTLHPDGGDRQREGKFSRYFQAAMRCIEPKFSGVHVAREIAERGTTSGENSD